MYNSYSKTQKNEILPIADLPIPRRSTSELKHTILIKLQQFFTVLHEQGHIGSWRSIL